jgi:hypothetical protein
MRPLILCLKSLLSSAIVRGETNHKFSDVTYIFEAKISFGSLMLDDITAVFTNEDNNYLLPMSESHEFSGLKSLQM